MASECKNLDKLCDSVVQFKPGTFICVKEAELPKNIESIRFTRYYNMVYKLVNTNEEDIMKHIRDKMDESITKRLLLSLIHISEPTRPY